MAQSIHCNASPQIKETSPICLDQPSAFAFDKRHRGARIGGQNRCDHEIILWVEPATREIELCNGDAGRSTILEFFAREARNNRQGEAYAVKRSRRDVRVCAIVFIRTI